MTNKNKKRIHARCLCGSGKKFKNCCMKQEPKQDDIIIEKNNVLKIYGEMEKEISEIVEECYKQVRYGISKGDLPEYSCPHNCIVDIGLIRELEPAGLAVTHLYDEDNDYCKKLHIHFVGFIG